MIRPGKTAPKVRGGKVQRKNRWELSPHYSINEGKPEIAREKPGFGKHYLRVEDVKKFIEILPDWDNLSVGLKAVVLAEAESDCYGWHTPGIVAVCAWDEELVTEWEEEFVSECALILSRIDVEIGKPNSHTPGKRYQELRFTSNSIKAFQLMDVLLHELGHHHDRMTTRSKSGSARGENFAEQYAIDNAEKLWDDYYRIFNF